jgi:hypothetical protein
MSTVRAATIVSIAVSLLLLAGASARAQDISTLLAPSTGLMWSSAEPEEQPATSTPEPPGPGKWFYRGLPYGSESLIHPMRLVLNGAFGTLQFDHRSNRLADVGFRHGWDRLRADLESPERTIALNGWSDFLRSEVAPVSFHSHDAQYWPNYTLHLIGGGMSSIMMHEWFEQHGYRHPALGAGVTIAAYHVLNEIVEAGERNGPSTDAIADLLIFDPAGAWLFSHEGVAGFFSRRLNLRDWSAQPAFDPTSGSLENNGQNFSIKLKLPVVDHWSLFYYFGNHGEAGLSYRFANGSALSGGIGMSASDVIDVGRGVSTANLVPSGGLFYDRNGSLLMSVMTAKGAHDRVRVNLYPGVLRLGPVSPGLFVVQARTGETTVGIHLTALPVGLAFKAHR